MEARFIWSATDVALFSLLVLVADDLNTPVIIVYPLLIAGAGLWFRERLVWFTTAACVFSCRCRLCTGAWHVSTGRLISDLRAC